jgi:hypothetical protein
MQVETALRRDDGDVALRSSRHRGERERDPPRLVAGLDEHRPGSNRLETLANVLDDPDVALIVVVPDRARGPC